MDNTPSPASAPMLARRLRAALAGGPAVYALPPLRAQSAPAGTALVVRTSGSTGTPREVAISADALVASAAATHDHLGGPGRWVLTLPATHIAGLQVIVRSLLATDAGVTDALVTGSEDHAAGSSAPSHFTPDALGELLARALADDAPVHVSLVPTQLHRVLSAADDGHPAGLDALVRCASVLVGGAATPAPLLARAASAGVTVVRTYGMSETAGGCVYDGIPLAGVRVRLAQADSPGSDAGPSAAGPAPAGGVGVVELSGPMLASGYVGDGGATAHAFRTDDDGVRWFRTNDLGTLHADDGETTLRVLGRADDVVVTGGVNVAPAAVEAVLAEVLPSVLRTTAVEPCVVGLPDDEWGSRLVAVVAVPCGGQGGITPLDPTTLTQVRAAVTARLGAPSAPRQIFVTASLPSRGPGKIDRRAVARVAAESLPAADRLTADTPHR